MAIVAVVDSGDWNAGGESNDGDTGDNGDADRDRDCTTTAVGTCVVPRCNGSGDEGGAVLCD
eukprot:1540320-Pyramimonas_sp.AAC.1